MNSDSKEIEELSGGWVRCRSKSNPGRQYFFNRKSGKSSWTQPQPGDKQNTKVKKNEPPKQLRDKKQEEGTRNKTVKRKSDGNEAGSSKKKHKNETPEKSAKKQSPKSSGKKKRSRKKTKSTLNKSPSKRLSLNDSIQSTHEKDSPSKITPSKNAANKRMSQLRTQLNEEASKELDKESPSKRKKTALNDNESPVRQRTDLPSPIARESIANTTISPSNDSLHSIPSPSQFFAANKIISSMKAQLPEEYSNKEKSKDSFADIEHGICSQMTEYPVIKHPSTPPQFSETSKLVSAIKSKLSYTPKDVKTFSSAKDRMEALRASISGEVDERDLQDLSRNDEEILCVSNGIISSEAQTFEAMEVEDIREPYEEVPESSFQPNTVPADTAQLVLVVDTNIFIHELDFIKNVLNSHIKGYSSQPMLLVPWRVINELDRLKDNNNGRGALCKRARAAMDYLYKSLPENSRIKGQSLRDSNSHIYPCEMPDDEILNCALQQAERGKNVLLLSNDRNLCNKAAVNGIRGCGRAELAALVEHPPRPSAPAAPGPAPSDTLRHCEQTIYELLANILENEMRAKYNNLWLHVLYKAPPWRLADVLQCLLKHWFAVFSEVFPRIEHLITDLKNTHARIEGKDPSTLAESEVTTFKELCVEVAAKCQIIPDYMELAKLTVERLARRASGTDDERARQTVVAAFEALWGAMSSYCAKLATALGVPHSVEDAAPAGETLLRLSSKFTEFHDCLVNFLLAVKGVLSIEDTSSMDEKVARLEAAFGACLRLASHESTPSREDLRNFCVTNRNMLQEALNKFSQLGQLLDVCRSRLPA